MSLQKLRGEEGVAMAIVLAMLVMISLIGTAALRNASTDMDISKALTDRTRAFYAAEGGLELALATMRQNSDTVDKDSLLGFMGTDSTLGGGYFQVAMTNDYPIRTVTSVGHDNEGESAVAIDVRHRRNPINPWNNAIFAGVGQTGRGIAGNVDIHGSVHILGEGEPFTDDNANGTWDDDDQFTDLSGDGLWQLGEPLTVDHDGDGLWDAAEVFVDDNNNGSYDETLTATDLSFEATGTAAVMNNYTGMPASISTRVPPLTTIPFNGENVQTLDAELRVKHGMVNLSGTAHVGDPDASGGSPLVKETMDGAFVNDGYGGTAGTGNVYSDNGTTSGYDLGDAIQFPSLNDSALGYSDHRAYLAANALIIPGDLEIEPGVSYNSPASAKGSLSVDANGNVAITGIVMVTGELRISAGQGGRKDDPLIYDGRGTLVSQGNMYVNTHLISRDQYPTNDVVGLISYRDLEIGTGNGASHLDVMAAIYSQQAIINEKQNDIAGAMVSNYFDMKNVPSIYHIPAIADNLPPGMPGGNTVMIYVWKEMPSTWREIYPVY